MRLHRISSDSFTSHVKYLIFTSYIFEIPHFDILEIPQNEVFHISHISFSRLTFFQTWLVDFFRCGKKMSDVKMRGMRYVKYLIFTSDIFFPHLTNLILMWTSHEKCDVNESWHDSSTSHFSWLVYMTSECVAVGCSGLQWVAVGCSGLQWVAMFTSHLSRLVYMTFGCVAVCCSVLQWVAVCCSGLQCLHHICHDSFIWHLDVLQCVAVCCRVFQCVAVCCRWLQCLHHIWYDSFPWHVWHTSYCNTLQLHRTATHCNYILLQHTATISYCNTLQLHLTATHCNYIVLQHTATTSCSQHSDTPSISQFPRGHTLQHTATRYHTLQHSATPATRCTTRTSCRFHKPLGLPSQKWFVWCDSKSNVTRFFYVI